MVSRWQQFYRKPKRQVFYTYFSLIFSVITVLQFKKIQHSYTEKMDSRFVVDDTFLWRLAGLDTLLYLKYYLFLNKKYFKNWR